MRPFKPDMRHAFLKPCLEYPFGTDNLGRCVFCRIIAGSKNFCFFSVVCCNHSVCFGHGIGNHSWIRWRCLGKCNYEGYFDFSGIPLFFYSSGGNCRNSGKWSDKRNPFSLCGLLDYLLPSWQRSLTVSLRNVPYIKAAKICGASRCSILFRYILPNVMPSLLVTAAMDVGSVILSMAGLSFLGLGAVRPTAEWGAVMSEAKDYLQTAPWIIVFNGIALFVVVTVFNLLGDSLRDVLDTEAEM